MSGINKEMQARTEGMELAYKIAKEKGLEELKKELKFRQNSSISLNMTTKELNAASSKIKEMLMDTILLMSVAVLHDQFGFGTKRCKQFADRFNLKANCLADQMISFQDYQQTIKEELGINLDIRFNN